jgi:hypothetical protein
MTIAEQLTMIREALDAWVRPLAGAARIAEDAVSLVGMLATAPGSPRALVLFDGEAKRGDIDELGRVDRRFLVVISRGRGLVDATEARLVETKIAGKPLFDLVEESREIVRAIRFDAETTEVIPSYVATRRTELDGLLVDAYQIEFSIGTQLPEDLDAGT